MRQICEVGEVAAEFSALNLNEEYYLEYAEVNKRIILKLRVHKQIINGQEHQTH
jgi:hypothetical protein